MRIYYFTIYKICIAQIHLSLTHTHCVCSYLLWRLLPLHASIVLGAPFDLIEKILTAYPNAAKQRDMNGSLPVHLASTRIHSHPDGERIVRQLIQGSPDSLCIKNGRGRTAIEIVANSHLLRDDSSKVSQVLMKNESEEKVSVAPFMKSDRSTFSFEKIVEEAVDLDCPPNKSGEVGVSSAGKNPEYSVYREENGQLLTCKNSLHSM